MRRPRQARVGDLQPAFAGLGFGLFQIDRDREFHVQEDGADQGVDTGFRLAGIRLAKPGPSCPGTVTRRRHQQFRRHGGITGYVIARLQPDIAVDTPDAANGVEIGLVVFAAEDSVPVINLFHLRVLAMLVIAEQVRDFRRP